MRHFGFTYNTESGPSFGTVQEVFEVPADWQGFRHHGYGAASVELEAALDREEITWEEFVASL